MRIRKDVIEIERIKNKNLRERPKWEKKIKIKIVYVCKLHNIGR